MNLRAAGAKTKRVLDMFLSSALLVASSPLWPILGVLVKLDSPGSAFFVQERVGKDGRPFRAYKFRTMVQGAASQGAGLQIKGQDDPRLTRVGKFLRRWSLDEVPQFVNIVKGEMSVVGPRPALLCQVEQYDGFQRRRLEVKPGITGWAQVHGRNLLSWAERIEYDVWYVDNWSFRLDMEIILRTLTVLIRGEGLYADEGKFIIRPQDQESE